MNYEIRKTTMGKVMVLFEDYRKTLRGVVDDFWEEHITKAGFYEIIVSNKGIGYFAIYNQDKITQFYIENEFVNLSQQIFKEILARYNIKTAYVSTGDQLFLSLCLDFHSKIDLQAYFFDGSVLCEVRPPEFNRACLFSIQSNELEVVKAKTGDFFDSVSGSDIDSGVVKLYQLCVNDEVLGYGIIVPNRLVTQFWACGMITLENKRQNGVGRSIQIHLGDICRENGFVPISGCWYHNHLSKKTIESAGRYSKTRLLNVVF